MTPAIHTNYIILKQNIICVDAQTEIEHWERGKWKAKNFIKQSKQSAEFNTRRIIY